MANEKPPAESPRWIYGLYLVAGIFAIVALALGLWDALVERDSGENLVMGVLFPILLLILVIVLYRRRKQAAR